MINKPQKNWPEAVVHIADLAAFMFLLWLLFVASQ